MKRVFISVLLVVLIALSGCTAKSNKNNQPSPEGSTSSDISSTVSPSVENSSASTSFFSQKDFLGYWLQVEEDESGEIKDLTDNPYAYLEVTDSQMFFYTISFDENEGYSVSEKYYIQENDKVYYDYNELKGDDFKEKLDPLSGGFFAVSFDENGRLELTEYYNDVNTDEGYYKDTYVKIPASDWPIEE